MEGGIIAGKGLKFLDTPRSTLLVLVDAFLGGDGRWRGIYDRALKEGFFFLSYGDAMLIL